MALEGGGRKHVRSQRDSERAALMKALGVERTTGRCAICYRIVEVDSSRSRWRHVCRR